MGSNVTRNCEHFENTINCADIVHTKATPVFPSLTKKKQLFNGLIRFYQRATAFSSWNLSLTQLETSTTLKYYRQFRNDSITAVLDCPFCSHYVLNRQSPTAYDKNLYKYKFQIRSVRSNKLYKQDSNYDLEITSLHVMKLPLETMFASIA